MNILFLTLSNIKRVEEKPNIYADLCRELVRRGHHVYIVCPDETGASTQFVPYECSSGVLKVSSKKIQKRSFFAKGFATLRLPFQLKKALKKHFGDIHFDLLVYSTPPITLYKVVKYIKKRDNAKTYLLLKDIFPQNAVDLGMMSKRGIRAPIYWYFRLLERKLYMVSDRIGCMSPANVEYALSHNSGLSAKIVEVCPNSFEPEIVCLTQEQKAHLRKKYNLPTNRRIFVYGGNLGKPQGVNFIVECMKAVADREDCFFVICGTGTEQKIVQEHVRQSTQKNLLFIPGLPRHEYESFVGCCDIGLIFLDWRFTIPNFPSRILSYMQKSMPVLACTDLASDIGKIAKDGEFGLWCPSNNTEKFVQAVDQFCRADLESMGKCSAEYFKNHYTVQKSADVILGASNSLDSEQHNADVRLREDFAVLQKIQQD